MCRNQVHIVHFIGQKNENAKPVLSCTGAKVTNKSLMQETNLFTSFAEFLSAKCAVLLTKTSMGWTIRSFLISWTTASDTLWRERLFLQMTIICDCKRLIIIQKIYNRRVYIAKCMRNCVKKSHIIITFRWRSNQS